MSSRHPSLFAVLLTAALAVVVTPCVAQTGPLTPEQREERWRQLTPEQRQQLWRNLTPEQKGEVIRNLTPEQRARIRERMEERMAEGRRLTPEERQKLRDQINEANRDFHNRPMQQRPGPRPRER